MAAFDDLLTLDAHNDSIILRDVRGDVKDFADVDPAYHVDLPRMRQGGMGSLFVMVGDSDLNQSVRLIDAVHRMAQTHPQDFALCRTRSEVRQANQNGQIGLVMSIEGQVMFAENLAGLRLWHELGVRVASLTHGEGNRGRVRSAALQVDRSHFGYLTPQERATLRRQTRGLTAFARESLAEMARLGIACDLAHANERTFWETLEYTEGPVCYTHGNCYSLCPHTRNCTDEMLKALADKDGVIGICFYGAFVSDSDPNLDGLVEHYLHALEIMGEDHVGVGTDFDGIGEHQTPVIPDPAALPELWRALDARGVSAEVMQKISRDNFLRMIPE